MAKWVPDLPMHIPHDDYSAEACEMRLHLYQAMFARSRGRGFRLAPGTSPKRWNPRRGHKPSVTRINTLYLIARYGERHAKSAV